MLKYIDLKMVGISLLALIVMLLGLGAVTSGIERITLDSATPPIGLYWGERYLEFYWFGEVGNVDVQQINQNIAKISNKVRQKGYYYGTKAYLVENEVVLAISESINKLAVDTSYFLKYWYNMFNNKFLDKNNSADLELKRI